MNEWNYATSKPTATGSYEIRRGPDRNGEYSNVEMLWFDVELDRWINYDTHTLATDFGWRATDQWRANSLNVVMSGNILRGLK